MSSSKKTKQTVKKSSRSSKVSKNVIKPLKQKINKKPKIHKANEKKAALNISSKPKEPKNCYEFRIAFENHWQSFIENFKNSRS